MTTSRLVQLDDYCRTRCTTLRCDANRDCGMLQFRRKREVAERLNDIERHLRGIHTAVVTEDLVRRFFLTDARRATLDSHGIRYLDGEYTRILTQYLQHDHRFRRFRTQAGRTAWALAGSVVADPSDAPTAVPLASAEPTAEVAARVLQAQGVVALRDLANSICSIFDEATLSSFLRSYPGVRCVAIDSRRGIGTHWAAEDWLRAQLPSDVVLWPVPERAFQPQPDQPDQEVGLNDGADLGAEEQAELPGATRPYTLSLDDVVSGSVVLRPADYSLFPTQPNPLAVQFIDEYGTTHQAFVLTRGGEREILGLAEFCYECGVGAQFRIAPGASPISFHLLLCDSPARKTGSTHDTSPARQVWRCLLSHPDGLSVDEIAKQTSLPPTQVQALLAAFRCFQPCPHTPELWRLDPTQPALRRRLRGSPLGHEADEAVAVLQGESQAFLAHLHQLEADIDDLERRTAALSQRRTARA